MGLCRAPPARRGDGSQTPVASSNSVQHPPCSLNDAIGRAVLVWGLSVRRKTLKTRTSNSEGRASEATNDASRKQEPARTRLPRLPSPPAPRPRRGSGHRAQRLGRQPRRRRTIDHVWVTSRRRP